VVVEVDRLVGREERVKRLVTERVGVGPVRTENHQVRNVHDAHAQLGNMFTEQGSGSDDLECDFDADPDQDAGG
jgi:hypothetical protein